MSKPNALVILPTGLTTADENDESDALEATARLLAEGLESLDLAERVERALRATGYPPLRAVQVTVHARRVILGGHVPTYYLKQVAQTTVLAVPGAEELQNDLDVDRPT
jgi:osmotically-inducible protein OsmY